MRVGHHADDVALPGGVVPNPKVLSTTAVPPR